MPERFVNGLPKISKLPREPSALTEPLLGKISAPHCDLRLSAKLGDDAYHIVAVRFVCDICDPAVDVSCSDDLPLLTKINSCFRSSDLVARTGFDFYECKCEWLRRFIVRNDVNLTSDLATRGAVAYRRDEIGCDYSIVFSLETLCGQSLAVSAQS